MKKVAAAMFALAALALFATVSFATQDKDKGCEKKCCQSASAASKDASKDPTKQEVVLDPVCGMDVKAEGCKYTTEYKGKTYCFCSKSCLQSFKKDPSRYIKEETGKSK